MGRYYSGDIEGKFWFAVQSSDCADRFGSTGTRPSCIEYYFDTDHLSDVKEEIKRLEEFLGDKKQKLDDFFANVISYSKENLVEMGITEHDLKEYADLLMGYKIRDCIEDTGECRFDAETN